MGGSAGRYPTCVDFQLNRFRSPGTWLAGLLIVLATVHLLRVLPRVRNASRHQSCRPQGLYLGQCGFHLLAGTPAGTKETAGPTEAGVEAARTLARQVAVLRGAYAGELGRRCGLLDRAEFLPAEAAAHSCSDSRGHCKSSFETSRRGNVARRQGNGRSIWHDWLLGSFAFRLHGDPLQPISPSGRRRGHRTCLADLG